MLEGARSLNIDRSASQTYSRPGHDGLPTCLPVPRMGIPPALPPRPLTKSSYLHPCGYTTTSSPRDRLLLDPRSSSTASLCPTTSLNARSPRRLLIIYIHGFLGSEASFGSFPAHLHYPLTAKLAATHAVHSKVYPRYRSRLPISNARDDFSSWLQPHEDDRTDVVLIGHSMGGILAADVTLLQPISGNCKEPSRHRILGIIGIDVPFLGISLRVVGTGLASLFRSKPAEAETSSQDNGIAPEDNEDSALPSETDHLNADPDFDPKYPNDKYLAQRTGYDRATYFIQKHSTQLMQATTQYIKSHLQFGGCLADYPGLKRRYETLRRLEDVDELQHKRSEQDRHQSRVRFVNYYSTTTGRVKPQRSHGRQVLRPARKEADMYPNSKMYEPHVGDADGDVSKAPSESECSSLSDQHLDQEGREGRRRKKSMKDRKFCRLPTNDAFGNADPAWVSIRMDGVDEVEAHISFFKASSTYKLLVDDVIARVETWVHEDQIRQKRQQEKEGGIAWPIVNTGA